MAPRSNRPDVVLVCSDQRAMAEALAVAMRSTDLSPVVVDLDSGLDMTSDSGPVGSAPGIAAGVLVCSSDSVPELAAARAVLAAVRVPWIVITSAEPGSAWDELRAVGAQDVLAAGATLDETLETLGRFVRSSADRG